MPTRMIYARHQGTDDHPAPRVELVSGRRGEYTQVRVMLPFPRRRPDDAPDTAGEISVPHVTIEDLTTVDGLGVAIYVDLDRDGINAMIRGLRDMRDKVHGRDE